MTFSFFAIMMLLIVGLVTFMHMLQGFFSAAISAVLAIFSAVLALSYHEVIVEKYLAGKVSDSAHGMALLMLFAGIYLVLRILFDAAVPGNLRLPSAADKAGAIVMGIIAGTFGAGIVAVAAQEMSFYPSIIGYARYAVDSPAVTVPNARKSQDANLTDQMLSPTFMDTDKQKLVLPVDDILVGMTDHLSDTGALSTSNPLSHLHPDWLKELFGQRLGVEATARRVLLATPGKTAEAVTDGVYLLTTPAIPWIDAEYPEVRGQSGRKANSDKTLPTVPGEIHLVVRVRFSPDAADREGGGITRISPGAVRLVTPSVGPSGEISGWTDNYPVATLQYRGPLGHFLPRFVAMGQNVDDFMFLKAPQPEEADQIPPEPGSNGQIGADFVFSVDARGLGWKGFKADNAADLSQLKLPAGSFVEVKRLVREDLSGEKILPQSDLNKNKSSIAVFRKTERLAAGLKSVGLVEPGTAVVTGSTPAPAVAPVTPAPVAPTPPAPAAAPVFWLDIPDPPDSPRLTDKFYTAIGTNAAAGEVTIPSGSMTLDSGTIRQLKIDGAAGMALRSAGSQPANKLFVPANMAIVQVVATPKPDAGSNAWSWKDKFADLALIDSAGTRIGPPVGVWAETVNGTSTTLVARYNADGNVSVADLPTKGQLKQVWFVFLVNHPVKIGKFVVGQTPIKDQAVDVP